MKKKNKQIIAFILVLIGSFLIIGGLFINQSDLYKEEANNEIAEEHKPEKVEKCKSISYDEKTAFVLKSNDLDAKDMKPILLTTSDEIFSVLSIYEIPEELETELDFNTYDYVVYFMSDNKFCNRTKYLTNYTYDNNKLTIEFTSSEANKSECTNEIFYAYGIAFEKGKFNLENTTFEFKNVEDPFKECYK